MEFTLKVDPRIAKLARRMHTTPWQIADIFGLNPALIEALLARHGYVCEEGESIKDLVARKFGNSIAEEVDSLLRGTKC